jgi:hypothetical protein
LGRGDEEVRDELNILKSVARFQKKVQLDLAGNYVKDTNLSADYVENDIKEMDSVADRIQSAVSVIDYSANEVPRC